MPILRSEATSTGDTAFETFDIVRALGEHERSALVAELEAELEAVQEMLVDATRHWDLDDIIESAQIAKSYQTVLDAIEQKLPLTRSIVEELEIFTDPANENWDVNDLDSQPLFTVDATLRSWLGMPALVTGGSGLRHMFKSQRKGLFSRFSRKGWFRDSPGHSLAARGQRVPWRRGRQK